MRNDEPFVHGTPSQKAFAALAIARLAFTAAPAQGRRGRPANRPAVTDQAGGAAGPTRARVMVLGVYHFDNPNLDYVKSSVDDHRSARRQAEISAVVEPLRNGRRAGLAGGAPAAVLSAWRMADGPQLTMFANRNGGCDTVSAWSDRV